MLKALELLGFKSFADKTRFEFPAGITVVVGPNGSGKSNIVDAMKWVLGEQSAKSLRGQEMSDVIFKGAGNDLRKPMNTAEVTIIFDNHDRRLPLDTPEVNVTRRVYRSGEGEYLINRQPSRLRDIRDIFRGTGAGSDAYSLIEQGKVDSLLSASPRDRRAIFEEAAGISRFKVKKVEATRRLERVEQNLLRLSDIVDEVDSRLRSVKSQAGKARRYKEYTERLQSLRTQVGTTDWRNLTKRLEELDQIISQLRDETAVAEAAAESVETHTQRLEVEIDASNESLRDHEALGAGHRERIATCESTVQHQRQRAAEMADEFTRYRETLRMTTQRVIQVNTLVNNTDDEVHVAHKQFEGVRNQLATEDKSLSQLTAQLESLRNANELRRKEHVDRMREIASLGKEIRGSEAEIVAAKAILKRCQNRIKDLEPSIRAHQQQLNECQVKQKQLTAELAEHDSSLDAARHALEGHQSDYRRRQQDLASLQNQLAAARERMSLLDELEKKQEGLSSGVKEVLRRARDAAGGPYSTVRGLVADLLQVNVETAPLIEIALGDVAQHVVVDGEQLWEQLRQGNESFGGRVGFVPLHVPERPTPIHDPLLNIEGVVGRADSFVKASSEFRWLAPRLLGRTWIVKQLDVALDLKPDNPSDIRFVTLAGELLEPDGTLMIGPRLHATGLISRRSQLRALREQIEQLENHTKSIIEETTRLDDKIRKGDLQARKLGEQRHATAAALAEQRVTINAVQQQHEQMTTDQAAIKAEHGSAEQTWQEAQQRVAKARTMLVQSESSVTEIENAIQNDQQKIERSENDHLIQVRSVTELKIELAKSEQKHNELQDRLEQQQSDLNERQRLLAETRRQLRNSDDRQRNTERQILQISSELAHLYLLKEQTASKTHELRQTRQHLISQRGELSRQAHQLRKQHRELEEKIHEVDLEAGQLRHERNSLAERLREDYGIELEQLDQQDQELTEEQQQARDEVEAEIAILRRKISNIGAVNMEALGELDELDVRYQSLRDQFTDLTEAKESLEKIINKINADSRKMFTETLEIIRENFGKLFRKVFGGGRADIVLEDGVDILESGIEIIATPPGKHSLGISLLSGGERALTAVTLLLAIFQYRPSPFCVLDEVDGPLDEANIERFIGVLNEFLEWTKFVIVTHSKKTMTAATTIYGVTMQESGVSKRVSVQFEDVNEDGHIHTEALTKDDSSDGAAA